LSTQKVEQLNRQETPSGKKSAGKCVNRLNSGVNASHGLSPFGPHFALLTDFLNCDLLTVAMAAGVGVYPIFFVPASTSAISSQHSKLFAAGQ